MSKSLEDFMSNNQLANTYELVTDNLAILSYKPKNLSMRLNGFRICKLSYKLKSKLL